MPLRSHTRPTSDPNGPGCPEGRQGRAAQGWEQAPTGKSGRRHGQSFPMSRRRTTASAQVTPSLIGAHPAGGSSPLAEDGPAQPGSAPEPKSGSLSVSRHGFVLCDSLNCATPPAGPTDGVRSTLRGLAHVSTPPGRHDLTASQGSRDYQHRHPRSVTSAPARRGSRSGASGYKQTKSRCDKYH